MAETFPFAPAPGFTLENLTCNNALLNNEFLLRRSARPPACALDIRESLYEPCVVAFAIGGTMNGRRIAIAMLLAAALTASAASQAQVCGTIKRHPRHYAHVFWIWMENHSFTQIVGSPDAPYINSLAAGCGVATNFHNITHFSLPNYIGAVTGLELADLQPFLLDCNPGGACLTPADSIFAHVPSWKAYMESMTTNCQPTGVVGYSVRHNPPPYLSSLADCGTFNVPYTELQTDLDNDTLPAFAFISPNSVNDMHDGPDPGAIQAGDTWLQNELPKILNSAAYQSGTTAVFVTFDEGEFGPEFAVGEDCANNTTDESCHIATIVISPYTRPGTTSDKFFNHYSLLKTTEKMLGVRKRDWVGLVKHVRSMRHAFHL